MSGTLKVWDGTQWQALAQGTPGGALPSGGAIDALLAKQSSADGDAAWTTAPVVGSISTGSMTVTSTVTFAEGANIVAGSGTGTKIGTSSTQKLAFYGSTPIMQDIGWYAQPGYTWLKSFDPNSATLAGLARVVGTLVETLKAYGLLGPP